MEELQIATIGDLDERLSKYRNGFLFRGQTSHYLDSLGRTSITSSFSRQGCVPPLMFKWTHYAKSLIRAFSGENYHDIDIGLSQAILQHYGWRSFYVDLTKSVHVACWFAANKYQEKRLIHMCENFEEEPVWLVHKVASYIANSGKGHLYVFDADVLKEKGVEIHDLTDLQSEAKLRFNTQEACLAGGNTSALPPESIVARFDIDQDVLVEFYARNSIENTQDIFPNRDDDYILNALLEISWVEAPSDPSFSIPIFRRGLEIPEYDLGFVKHLNPRVTLFSGFWISKNRLCPESQFCKIPFYRLPEFAYYANTNEDFDLSEVNKILQKHPAFIVELDSLVYIPELRSEHEYEKGLYVEKVDENTVSVMGLSIDHPGHVVAGFGANRGWYYEITDGNWKRIEHVDECPCNNNLRHELQFSLLRILNELLKEGEIIEEDELNFRHKEINHA